MCLFFNPFSSSAQMDTLMYKQGSKKIYCMLIRSAENRIHIKSLIDNRDLKIVNDSDSLFLSVYVCPVEENKRFISTGDWNWYATHYLGNAFWTRLDPRNKSFIWLNLEKDSVPVIGINIEKSSKKKDISYSIKCDKVKLEKTRQLYIFGFYRLYHYKLKNEWKYFLSPFSSGKFIYLHNIGFICIKVPFEKSLRLKLINGYPWRKYINKINPNYLYFSKPMQVF